MRKNKNIYGDEDGDEHGNGSVGQNFGIFRDPDSSPYAKTPFSLAAVGGNVEVLRVLIGWNGGVVPPGLEWGMGIHLRSASKVSLLILAAERGHLSVVRMLVGEFGKDKGVDVNAVDRSGRNALGRMAMAMVAPGAGEEEEGQEEGRGEVNNRWLPVMRLLLEHGADLEKTDVDGRTPLALVAICTGTGKGCESVARLFMEHGADPSREDQEGWTPLAIAARTGCVWLVRLLLEYGSNDGGGGSLVDVNVRDHNRLTPLCHAASGGHEDIVRLLLQQGGAHPDPVDIHGYTPLLWAVEGQQAGIVQMLLENPLPVDVNRQNEDVDTATPFIKSVCTSEAIVRLLLTLGKDPDINALSTDGIPVLVLAVADAPGQPDNGIIHALLEQEGIIADQRDGEGMTALMHATSVGIYGIVEALVSRADVDVNSRDHTGKTPLCHLWPSTTESVEIVRLLLEHGADVNASDDGGRTLFSEAWDRHAFDLMEFLLDVGAEPLWVNSKSEIDADTHADADADTDEKCVFHPGGLFQLAMKFGHAKLVKRALVMIVDNGIVDPTIRLDEHGRTPLCVAAVRGLGEVAKVLLAHSSDKNGRTAQPLALTLAAMNGYNEIVRLLLDTGGSDSDSTQGYMHLLRAMGHGYQEVVKMFRDLHEQAHSAIAADSPLCYPSWLPLFLAALYGHEEVVKTLMASHSASVAKMMMGMQNVKMEETEEGHVEGKGVVNLTPLWLAAEHIWATGGTESSVAFMQYRPKHSL
ncbi:hypothetical protein EMCG_00144 [[Emmonsia] crescens]|uniref:Uncharacterized protein n=1 Tax=[Emmonsia] crescens TaxID=73230 RepID=A0A0G2HTL4_9EURO|nr:hypothetical protein EMCG_00144 [Emmonsia crescens UAMH 3008]